MADGNGESIVEQREKTKGAKSQKNKKLRPKKKSRPKTRFRHDTIFKNRESFLIIQSLNFILFIFLS